MHAAYLNYLVVWDRQEGVIAERVRIGDDPCFNVQGIQLTDHHVMVVVAKDVSDDSSVGLRAVVPNNAVTQLRLYAKRTLPDLSSPLHLTIVVTDAVAKTDFHSVTFLPGRELDKSGIDIQGNEFRVATKLQKRNPHNLVTPLCDSEPYTNRHEIRWFVDQCMNRDNWAQCSDMAQTCLRTIKEGCPYAFYCLDDPNNKTEATRYEDSSTDNHIVVLDLSSRGAMVELGRARIGHEDEIKSAVRFEEGFVYAATAIPIDEREHFIAFDQRESIHIVELPVGQTPVVTGRVELDGFASFFHPFTTGESTMLVGIGQNTSRGEWGQSSVGVMVTVSDVSNPNTPVVVDSLVLGDETAINVNLATDSNGEWNFQTVQYNIGIITVPLSRWPWDSLPCMPYDHRYSNLQPDFDGFFALDVGNARHNSTRTTEVLRVTCAAPLRKARECNYCGSGPWEQRRSFLYDDGSLMTMYLHDSMVRSTNITMVPISGH